MEKPDIFRANGAEFLAADDMIVRWVRKESQPFEPVTYEFIRAALKWRRGKFIDVGASTGWFAVPMAMNGADVICFECNPRAAQRLRANIALNRIPWERIQIVQAAASSKLGTATFLFNSALPLTSGGSIERAGCRNPGREEVETVTLDSVTADPVALIKIDVEGHEMAVLKGAARIIEESRPHLVLEANSERHFLEIEHWLDERAYLHHRADERNVLAIPEDA